MNKRDEEGAKAAATRLVLQRMRGRRELLKRLTDSGYLLEYAEAAVEMLARNGYIDDVAFARAFILDKMRLRGHGETRIRQELRALGVAADDIEQGFKLCDMQCEEEGEPRLLRELQNALHALKKNMRGRTFENAADARRAVDALRRRGFAFPVIKEAVKLYRQEHDSEDNS